MNAVPSGPTAKPIGVSPRIPFSRQSTRPVGPKATTPVVPIAWTAAPVAGGAGRATAREPRSTGAERHRRRPAAVNADTRPFRSIA